PTDLGLRCVVRRAGLLQLFLECRERIPQLAEGPWGSRILVFLTFDPPHQSPPQLIRLLLRRNGRSRPASHTQAAKRSASDVPPDDGHMSRGRERDTAGCGHPVVCAPEQRSKPGGPSPYG